MKSQKKALILTADKFEDLEVLYPLYRLTEAGWQVIVAAPNKDQISGEHGCTLNPAISFEDANADEFDLLIIPGGFPDGAPATIRKHKKAQQITKAFFAKNKVVASICHGSWTLASADVIKKRTLTSYWHDGVPESIRAAGRVWHDEEVVVDENLITSRWPMDLPAFMRETMKKFVRTAP